MSIQGGTLEFDVLFNSGQIDRAFEETKRRVQGFSDATAAGGAKMEAAYQSAARYIEKGFETIGTAISINETAVANLRKKYDELGEAAGEALMKGKDNKYNALLEQQSVIKGEIRERKKVVAALQEQDEALQKHNHQLEEEKRKIENAANAQTTLRTQLRKVTEELAMLEENGRKAGLSLSEIRGSEKFRELQQEAGRLTNAMGDARTQARILAHDNAGLQGVISAVSGVTGAFTVAQGAIGLFGEKNEDLQKIMLRVQSLMAISMGMQQVANTLNKDSALMIKLNAWWLGVKAKAQVTDTSAATAGTVANVGLAGAFRLVGAAIKSIPVFGWIAAGIGALIGVISIFSSKAREAKKATEEFHKAVAESASKPIAEFRQLQSELENVGDSFQKKMSIIKDLKKMFEDLGISINGVIDAEKILTNPANVNAFIAAQIAKARAAAKQLEIEKLEAEAAIAQQKLEDAQKTPKTILFTGGGQFGGGSSNEIDNPEIEKQERALQAVRDKMTAKIHEMGKYQKEAYEQIQKATEGAIIAYADGTIGQLEQAKEREEEALEGLKGDNTAYKAKLKDIENIQKQIDAITGKGKKDKEEKDPVIERIEQVKKAYQEYFKWVNAGYQSEAKQEFSELLKGGKTYKEYLENRKKDLLKNKTAIAEQMKEIGNGNVDLLSRPMIDAAKLVEKGWKDAGKGIATVFSSQYGILDKNGKEVEILVTPILPDGSVLSEKELKDYIYNDLEGVSDILKADTKGLVISVGVNKDGTVGEALHQLQEQYYLTSDLSKRQKELLKTINSELSEQTQKTTFGEFESSLQKQLNNAQTVFDKLNIIKKQREELAKATEESDLLKSKKGEIINKQEEDVEKQANEDFAKAKKEYADYLDNKINADTKYFRNKEILELKIAQETDEKRKKILQTQLQTHNQSYDTKQLIDYDALVEEYKSYKKRIEDISKQYDDQIALATKNNNLELIAALQKAKEKALSAESMKELEKSDTYTQLFGNLDNLSVQKMIELRNKLEEEWSKLKLSPKELEALRDKINELTNTIEQKNPFAALADAIKRYKEALDKAKKNDALKDMFSSASASINQVKQGFDSIADGLKKIGLAVDEETQRMMDDFSTLLGGASSLAKGLATGNPVQIIQGSVDILTSSISILDSGARKRNAELKKEMEYYNALVGVYDTLISKQKELTASMSGKKAFEAYEEGLKMIEAQEAAAKQSLKKWFSQGGSLFSSSNQTKYDDKFGSILSRKELLKMSADEWKEWISNNKENWAKLPEEVQKYAEAVMDAGVSTEELTKAMQEATAGFSLDNAKSELEELIKSTELSFADISDSFYKLMENAIMRIIQGKFDTRLQEWYEKVVEAMKDDVLTEAEKERLRKEYEDIVKEADAKYEATKDLAGFSSDREANPTSLSGAIKGASQESIDLLAGQTNAVRVNQVESIEILRDSLIQLTLIYANTSRANQHLAQIEKNTNNTPYDPLRAEGIKG